MNDTASPGVDDGTVLDTRTHDGQSVAETIIMEKNEAGDVIGWHKETATGA